MDDEEEQYSASDRDAFDYMLALVDANMTGQNAWKNSAALAMVILYMQAIFRGEGELDERLASVAEVVENALLNSGGRTLQTHVIFTSDESRAEAGPLDEDYISKFSQFLGDLPTTNTEKDEDGE